MAVSYTVRNATTTNSVGHSYQGATQTYSATRWYTSFDLSAWDEASSGTWNGPTADGSLSVSWVEGDTPPNIQV